MAGFEVEGLNELIGALQKLQQRGADAARPAAEAMAREAQTSIKAMLSTSSHAPGTKTPSPPGSPPSMITGRLRDSTEITKSFGEPGHWETHAAPTTVYARIQDLGGDTGPDHQTHLPPRPYLKPAMVAIRKKLEEVSHEVFRKAIEGG